VKVKLYIEGGGDSPFQATQFREGWTTFFQKAGLSGRMPAVVRGGGREQTFDAFKTAVKVRKADELPLLLVDSEDLVAQDCSVWSHLKSRDGWDMPATAGNEDAFLMVTCMEAWFLADRAALKRFFHEGWRDHALPQWSVLSEIPKERIFQALTQATAGCGNKAYSKGKRSFTLLKAIDPNLVEQSFPSAVALLDRLRGL
jgi:hypothetical protein